MLYFGYPTNTMASLERNTTTTTTIVEGDTTTTITTTITQIPGEENKFNRCTEQTVVPVTNIKLDQCEKCKDFNNHGNNVYCKCYAKCVDCGEKVYNGEKCECQVCSYCGEELYDGECGNCD